MVLPDEINDPHSETLDIREEVDNNVQNLIVNCENFRLRHKFSPFIGSQHFISIILIPQRL